MNSPGVPWWEVLLQSARRSELVEGFEFSINHRLPVRLLAGLDSVRKGLQFHLFTPNSCSAFLGYRETALTDTAALWVAWAANLYCKGTTPWAGGRQGDPDLPAA